MPSSDRVPGQEGVNDAEEPSADLSLPATPQRRRRRASRPAPPGSDPAPYDPPTEPRASGENDDRLKSDRPPHWG